MGMCVRTYSCFVHMLVQTITVHPAITPHLPEAGNPHIVCETCKVGELFTCVVQGEEGSPRTLRLQLCA